MNDEIKRDMALMLAKLFAEDDTDEAVLQYMFDRMVIPTLGAGEQIEVKVRRIHKDKMTMPSFIWRD